jgi:ABC-type Na+ efflux pump permease subunit
MTTVDAGAALRAKSGPAPAARSGGFNFARSKAVAMTELRQFATSKDHWIPMVFLGILFFVFIPGVLLGSIASLGESATVQSIAETVDAMPGQASQAVAGMGPQARASYILAVVLFAPVSVVVPLTISSAIGAATIVGEREKGTGEFLAHSPAGVRELFVGKLVASFVPGYTTALVGFGLYSLMVNLIAGPAVGRWFFPTTTWLVLIGLTIPAFLMIGLAIVVRVSARVSSTAAAQQIAGIISIPLIGLAYSQANGSISGGIRPALITAAIAWAVAAFTTWRGVLSVKRSRLLTVLDDG